MLIPTSIVAGDRIVWRHRDIRAIDPQTGQTVTLDPAVHTLSFAIRGTDSLDVTAVADGADFLTIIEPAQTGSLTAGNYFYQVYVSRGTARNTFRSGAIEVIVNYAEETEIDARSQLEKDLQAIESAIRVVIGGGVQSYSIQGRSLSRLSLSELMALRDKYKSELQSARAAEAVMRGESDPRRAKVRFAPH